MPSRWHSLAPRCCSRANQAAMSRCACAVYGAFSGWPTCASLSPRPETSTRSTLQPRAANCRASGTYMRFGPMWRQAPELRRISARRSPATGASGSLRMPNCTPWSSSCSRVSCTLPDTRVAGPGCASSAGAGGSPCTLPCRDSVQKMSKMERSKCSGAWLIARSALEMSNVLAAQSTKLMRLPCESMMPLGSPVEPDV